MTKRSLILNGALLLIIAVLLVFSLNITFAWFYSQWNGERQLSFAASEGEDPVFYAWIYDVNNENSGETILETTGSWRNIALSGTGDGRSCEIEHITERNVANSEKYVFTSLHMGTVDNLISLSNDNYMYLRLDVDDVVRRGRKVRLGYSLERGGVHFYDLEGVDHTAQLTNATLDDFISLVNVEYAVSTTKYDPATTPADAASLAALFTDQNALGFGQLTNGAALTDVFAAEQTNPYVLYLRFYPDLDACFDVTEFLGEYMPCETLYDLDLTLDFYQIHT
ncbi:MAG: hypothetical protein J6Z79_07940 [Clostridia bacterium]|nr:hypothetical protein [Clostridia bacterium]